MYKNIFISGLVFTFLVFGCIEKDKPREVQIAAFEVEQEVPEIIVGAERLALFVPQLKEKKVALVVNHTSMVTGKHLVDTLLKLDVQVKKVFAPEHGFRGDKSDGEKIADNIDVETGLRIISLYGKNRKPSPDDLSGVDIVVFDIQDVGARFYTYLSTMHYVMEACAEQGKKIIVLDRPNPHADYVDGPVLESGMETFVGLHPVPVVYGMTIGEYAKMINGEGWLKNGVKADLEVIELKNYARTDYYAVPIKPSPNLPNMKSILLYPSICFFEGTSVSVGRGTDLQFQVLGHPMLENMPFSFIPQPNEGSKYPPQEGKECFGENLSQLTLGSLTDKNQLDLSYLFKYLDLTSKNNVPFFLETNHFDRLAGTKDLKQQLLNGATEEAIRASWVPGLNAFKQVRQKYLIYPG